MFLLRESSGGKITEREIQPGDRAMITFGRAKYCTYQILTEVPGVSRVQATLLREEDAWMLHDGYFDQHLGDWRRSKNGLYLGNDRLIDPLVFLPNTCVWIFQDKGGSAELAYVKSTESANGESCALEQKPGHETVEIDRFGELEKKIDQGLACLREDILDLNQRMVDTIASIAAQNAERDRGVGELVSALSQQQEVDRVHQESLRQLSQKSKILGLAVGVLLLILGGGSWLKSEQRQDLTAAILSAVVATVGGSGGILALSQLSVKK